MLESNSANDLVKVQRQLLILVLTLLAAIIISQLCAYFADVLRILGVSILFAYLFLGSVDWLNKYLKNRGLAVLIVYGAVLIGIAFSTITVIPTVVSQISQLLNNMYLQLPRFIQNTERYIFPLEQHLLHHAQIEIKTIDLINGVVSVLPKVDASQVLNRMSDVAVSTMTSIIYILSILILSFYFLLDGHTMPAAIIKLFPNKHKEKLELICTQIDKSLQAFLRGQVILAICFGMIMVIIYYILGVHYALLLGIILAILEVIPVIGPPIGFVPTIFVVAFDGMDHIHAHRITQLLIVSACFYALQWLKDNIFAPKYIGNVIGMHPLIVFLAIMVGARIDGWLGIIFALPVSCIIQVVAKNIGYSHWQNAHRSRKANT